MLNFWMVGIDVMIREMMILFSSSRVMIVVSCVRLLNRIFLRWFGVCCCVLLGDWEDVYEILDMGVCF